MHEKSADRHHNPARLTTASNHLRGSLRRWRDFTMIGYFALKSFRCGNLAGCEQYVLQRWYVATMRCKGTQKTSITETFGTT